MRTLKIFMAVAIFATMVLGVEPVFAYENAPKGQKEQSRIRQESKDALYKRVDRSVKKEVKKLEREGWKTVSLPIAKQLERSWEYEWQMQDDGYPKYITVTVIARGSNFSAAQMEAENVAKVRIASNIGASVTSLADVALANKEISPDQSASLSQVLENSKLIVSQKLGRVFPSATLYREGKKNVEVRVTAHYDMQQALEIAHEVIMEQLKNESDENRAQLEQIMGIDKMRESYSNGEFNDELVTE